MCMVSRQVAGAYLLFGLIWVATSDQLVQVLAPGPEALTWLQTWKGWGFVLLSALLIQRLTRSAMRSQARQLKEKQALYLETVRGSQHIVGNYLNQMQIVLLEADGCPGFDPAIIRLAEDLTERTAFELRALEHVQVGAPKDIRAAAIPWAG